MPIREAIVDSVLPKEVERPIPVRTISTRTIKPVIKDQQSTSVGDQVAASTTPAESVRLSPQLSALARKEQAFRQREQALKDREKQLEAKLTDADKFSQLKTKLSSKDYAEAEALGLNYEGYTEYLLNKQAKADPAKQEMLELKAKIEALEKGTEESATKQYEDTVSEYKKEIKSLIESDPAFSKIKKLGRDDAVLQLILDSWEEDETELSVQDAAKYVEEFLTEEKKKWDALTDEPSSEVVDKKTLPPPKLGSKTLTQNMMAGATEKKPVKSLQHLSESERYAEARRRVLERRQQQ